MHFMVVHNPSLQSMMNQPLHPSHLISEVCSSIWLTTSWAYLDIPLTHIVKLEGLKACANIFTPSPCFSVLWEKQTFEP